MTLGTRIDCVATNEQVEPAVVIIVSPGAVGHAADLRALCNDAVGQLFETSAAEVAIEKTGAKRIIVVEIAGVCHVEVWPAIVVIIGPASTVGKFVTVSTENVCHSSECALAVVVKQ